jgi:glucosamine--fructose-6-phosphate aminotransferase (isomerizing)
LVARTPVGDFAASVFAAIADWADEYRVLEDGDVVDLTRRDRWSRRGNTIMPAALVRSTWHGGGDVELDGYSDYMAKEIDEQPNVACRLLDDMADGIANGDLWSDLGLPSFDRLRIVGCGTSLNAGRVIGNLARRLGGLPAAVTVASEAAEEIADAHELCLAISQSGETADVLQAVRSDGVGFAPILALTNNPHSTLARRADGVITCNAGPEIGVAATKTFVCQIIAGAALMISAFVATGRLSSSSAVRLVDELWRIPDQLAEATTIAKCVVPALAEEIERASGFIFIARGTGVPYAAEGALKIKEITYRWAEHCPAGELKHGPLALVGKGIPVIVVDNADAKLATNVAEVRARGGRVITIGPAGSDVPVVGDPYVPWGPITTAVPLQILARTIALAFRRDVDKPRNLTKSVTVE